MARHDLGLSVYEWLKSTPRMVYALRKRQLAEWQRQEFIAGQMAATTANFGFCRPKKVLRAEDFMIHPWPKARKRRRGRITNEELLRIFDPRKWRRNG